MTDPATWGAEWLCARCRRVLAEPGDDDRLCRACRVVVDRLVAGAKAGIPRSNIPTTDPIRNTDTERNLA